jgi:hypothetical protein
VEDLVFLAEAGFSVALDAPALRLGAIFIVV